MDSSHGLPAAREPKARGLLAGVRAIRHARKRRALRRRADEQLLAGTPATADSPLLERRARELTSDLERRVLARSLERTARELEGSVVLEAVPLNRAAARPHVDLIWALAARLRETARPVSPRGVLLVEELVGNGNTSPLYVRERAGDLVRTLEETLEALEPESGAAA